MTKETLKLVDEATMPLDGITGEDAQDGYYECPLCHKRAFGPVTSCLYCEDTMKLNGSGIQPVEFKVIVKVDEDEAVSRIERSGLILPPDSKDRERLKQVTGILVACGGDAFGDWRGIIPKIGDRVYFAKYAGLRIQIREPEIEWYQLINDKDIAGIIIEDKVKE